MFTGLRDGEKLHEDLFGDGEFDVRPVHKLISHVPVPALTFESVLDAHDRHELPMDLLLNRLATGDVHREVA